MGENVLQEKERLIAQLEQRNRELESELADARRGLHSAEEAYASAMRVARYGMWEWDLVEQKAKLSPRLREELDYSPSERSGFNADFMDMIHPDDHLRLRDAMVAHIQKGVPYDVTLRIRAKGGAYRWFHSVGQAQRDPQGVPLRIVGYTVDVTAQRAAEEALRDSELLFRSIFEATTTAVTLRDIATRRLIDCNKAALALYKCKNIEELSRLTPVDLAPPLQPDGASSAEFFARTFEKVQRERVSRFEWTAMRTDGETFPAEVRLIVIELQGRLVLQGMVEDITERKRAEQALAKSKEDAVAASMMKSAFLANMSHELRTPLNGVIGMVDLLTNTRLDDKQRRYAEVARSSASLLLSVINDILDFSKIEAGKLDFERLDFEFEEVIEEVASILMLSAEDKGLELTWRTSPDLPVLLVGDPARLRQVLLNLVNNAIKFTGVGEVAVRASLESETDTEATVRVEVRDTGIGIDQDAAAKLFRPFSQVDASTTREYGGTGLGLAICHGLIEQMNGRLGVTSKPQSGSTFWFEVPLAKSTSKVQKQGPSPLLAGVKVLCVDDNATNRELLEAHLASAGMECSSAPDGRTALRMMQEVQSSAPYRLVILDQNMPGMSGRELAQKIQADPNLGETRMIMIGSVDRTLESQERDQIGITAYATKPIWKKQLLHIVEKSLDGSALERPDARGKKRENAEGRGRRILLVEDSPINAEVAGEILKLAGYSYDLATDGLLAIEATLTKPYDLILMDCYLPERDGYEATRRIRELEASGLLPGRGGKRIPIVALTASATKEDVDRAIASGMNDHISKPVDADRLLGTIAAQLGSPATADEPGAREHARAAGPVIANLDRALARIRGNRSLLRRMIDQFVEGSAGERARLADAVARRDSAGVSFTAHRLGGQAASLDGEALVAELSLLSHAARASSWSDADKALVQVETALDLLLDALAEAAPPSSVHGIARR